jgi:hypothetical protein
MQTLSSWQFFLLCIGLWISACSGLCAYLLFTILRFQASQNDELSRLTRPKGVPGGIAPKPKRG